MIMATRSNEMRGQSPKGRAGGRGSGRGRSRSIEDNKEAGKVKENEKKIMYYMEEMFKPRKNDEKVHSSEVDNEGPNNSNENESDHDNNKEEIKNENKEKEEVKDENIENVNDRKNEEFNQMNSTDQHIYTIKVQRKVDDSDEIDEDDELYKSVFSMLKALDT